MPAENDTAAAVPQRSGACFGLDRRLFDEAQYFGSGMRGFIARQLFGRRCILAPDRRDNGPEALDAFLGPPR